MTKICTLLILLLPIMGSSKNPDDLINLNIKGRLVTPPKCNINKNKPIEVDFYEVNIKYIKDDRYKRYVDLQVECEQKNQDWKMYLTLIGETNRTSNAIKTNVENLFVKFKLNNRELILEKKYLIDSVSYDTLEAILEINRSPKLGVFWANATIIVEYD